MREIAQLVDVLNVLLELVGVDDTPARFTDQLPIATMCNILREKTEASSPYSKAARAALIRAGYAELCVKSEELDDLIVA